MSDGHHIHTVYTHSTEEEKLVKIFLTWLDFTNWLTVSILSMFWWELVHPMTNHSILKWGPTSSIGSSLCHHVMNKFFNVLCPNRWAYWGWLASSCGVSGATIMINDCSCLVRIFLITCIHGPATNDINVDLKMERIFFDCNNRNVRKIYRGQQWNYIVREQFISCHYT